MEDYRARQIKKTYDGHPPIVQLSFSYENTVWLAEFNGDVGVLTGIGQTYCVCERTLQWQHDYKISPERSNPQIWIRCTYCNQTCTTFAAKTALARANDHSFDNDGCNVAVLSCCREAISSMGRQEAANGTWQIKVVYLQALCEVRDFILSISKLNKY